MKKLTALALLLLAHCGNTQATGNESGLWDPTSLAVWLINKTHTTVTYFISQRTSTIINCAIESNNISRIEQLIPYTTPDTADTIGLTPLHCAINCGNTQAAQLLLSHKADPNLKDSQGEPPLWNAIVSGHHEIAKSLLQHGANPHYVDEDQDNLLHVAALDDNITAARLLILYGVSPDQANRHGVTPMKIAADHRFINLVALFQRSMHTQNRSNQLNHYCNYQHCD